MCKFIYEDGDFEVAENQCEFCIFNNKQTPENCEKCEKKPTEIMQNKLRCPFAKDNFSPPWQE